jgi:hypothetical protein
MTYLLASIAGGIGGMLISWALGLYGPRKCGGVQVLPDGTPPTVMVERDGLLVSPEMADRLDAARQALRQEQQRMANPHH